MMSSSHSKSQASAAGWMRAHEKMASNTTLTPACCMSAMSSSQTSRGHCSGL